MMKTLDNDTIFAYLDKVFLAKLSYLADKNPKILVVFSGVNGVGKSSLSKRLQDEFHGLVLENDALRAALVEYEPSLVDNRELLGNLVWQYTQDLYTKLPTITPNGLVIRDAVIHEFFELILPIFEQAGYELFIVRFELSREKQRELLYARGGKEWIDVEALEAQFDKHELHSAHFLSKYVADVVLTDESVFEYDQVVDALRKKLSS